ncbi:hypothetical protein BS47DRAFT_1306112 [Hydnum rufescens UP504]|uniref:Uncharacterized protein n=1 Tax=Hydnum rufescens UP504 TaxID=1448309 RepID=A0A9P6AHG7_9AGAM|nr:hypothetical protein BS47DRAFT_1306112 [Hydnum rufescens UP504]
MQGALAPSKFKESAQPLHLHITHTPPSAGEKPEDGSTAEAAVATDAGHVASISIQPTDFSTGSYGWKGNRRVNVELTNPETGHKETVAVMINVNATVVGSKSAKDPKADEAEAEEKEEAHEEAPQAAHEEAPQATHDTAPPEEK